jgi:hypothetical protein
MDFQSSGTREGAIPDLRGYNLPDKPLAVDDYCIPVLLEDIRSLADRFRNGRKFPW